MDDQDDYYNVDIVHDFLQEQLAIMVLGGFVFLKEKRVYLVLNTAYITLLVVLHLIMDGFATETIIVTSFDRGTCVLAFQLLCLSVPAMLIMALSYVHGRALTSAMRTLRGEVFHYPGLELEKRLIMSERTSQARGFIRLITVIILMDVFSSSVCGPLVKTFVFARERRPEDILNPFLPLPVHMPFDTYTFLGYAVAFLAHSLFYFFIHATFICHEQVTLSIFIQLSAQLEVLNYSLRNIERRAYIMLRNRKPALEDEGEPMEVLYDDPEFQSCLYHCLRENAKHHLKILRLKDTVAPYIESTSAVALLFFSAVLAAAMILILKDFKGNFAFGIMVFTDVVGFLQLSWVGQMVTDLSADTKTSLYSTPWYNCNTRFTKLLHIMLSNTQRPIVLRASGLNYDLSLETFADMISLGYKIMNLLL